MDNVKLQVDWSIDFWPSMFFSGLGTVTNVVNTVVFWSLEFHESSTISLMVIAVTDSIKCAVSFLYRGYVFCGMVDRVLEVNWMRVSYLVSTCIKSLAMPVANVVTMYLTLERCICLCLPLSVKSLITPRVTTVVLCMLIGAVITFLSPVLFMYRITWMDDPYFNHTIVIYSPTEVLSRDPSIFKYLDVTYVLWSVAPFVSVVVCTAIFIVKLRQHWRFRSKYLTTTHNKHRCQHNVLSVAGRYNEEDYSDTSETIVFSKSSLSKTSPNAIAVNCNSTNDIKSCKKEQRSATEQRSAKVSIKEVRLVKMLLLVVLVYFISILPRVIIGFTRTIEPDFNVNRKMNDLFLVSNAICFLIDLIVANSHIFIYLTMSTQYRETFCWMFNISRRK